MYEKETKDMEEMIDFITRVRTYKLEQKVPKEAVVYYVGKEKELVFKKVHITASIVSTTYPLDLI